MSQNQRLIQAYQQTPWRKQLQIIGLFSASVIFVSLVAGVYLNVTARAATTGREIQDMQTDIQTMSRNIESLEIELAQLTSSQTMRERAQELGFIPVTKEQIVYLEVPGYQGRRTAEIAPKAIPPTLSTPVLPKEYTISLFDWVKETIYLIGLQTGADVGRWSP